MLYKKSIRLILSVLCIYSLTIQTIHAMEDDIDIFNDPRVTDFVANTEFDVQRSFDPATVIAILKDLGAIEILKEDIYLKTHPLVIRSLLDLPQLRPHYYHIFDWGVGAHLFLNQTSAVNFGENSTGIKCYLALQDETLLEKIQCTIDTALGLLPNCDTDQELDITEMLSLFRNGTIQQRRAGFMINGWKTSTPRRFDIMFNVPFYYTENNYFLTDKERAEIERVFGKSNQAQEDSVVKHLVSDKIGFGDFRLYIGREIHHCQNSSLISGVQFTLPTGFALGSGLIGSKFNPCRCLPTIDVESIFGAIEDIGDESPKALAQREKLLERAADLLLGAAYQLNANILETKMGNSGHFGIGGYIDTETYLSKFIDGQWARYWSFRGHISLEYLAPATETRFFIEQRDDRQFDERDFMDKDQAQDNLNFLERKMITRLYPFAYDVKVSPGLTFNYFSKWSYEGNRWGFTVGSDTWIIQQEKQSCPTLTCSESVNLCKAIKPSSYQWRALASLFYKSYRKEEDWIFSLNIDKVVWSKNIGKDFTVSLGFHANF